MANDDNASCACASRREFLQGSAAVLATPVVLPVLSACGGGGGASAAPVTAAAVAQLSAGQPLHVTDQNVFLMMTDQGIGAMSDLCPHRSCAVDANGDGSGFTCPCHASTFDAMGAVLTPPARSDLEWYAVSVEDGQVMVDKSSVVPAGTFTPAS